MPAKEYSKGILKHFCMYLHDTGKKSVMSSGLSYSYDRIKNTFENSAVYGLFSGKKATHLMLRFRNTFSYSCEHSAVLGFIDGLPSLFLNANIKNYGIFGVLYSLFSLISKAADFYLDSVSPSLWDIAFPLILLLTSVPLFFSDSSLNRLISGSYFFGNILFKGVGIPLRENNEKNELRISFTAPFIAAILGICVHFTGTKLFPILFITVLALALILKNPESGFCITLAVTPFLGLISHPSLTLAVLVCFSMLSFIFKWLRGRRVFRFSPESVIFSFLLMGILLAAFPVSGNSAQSALLTSSLMLGFILAVNLFRDKIRLEKAACALVLSAALVSSVGIIQYITGTSPKDWFDFTLFSSISGRTVSVFGNPNMLGAYLTLVFPFCLCLAFGKNQNFRFTGITSAVLVLLCGILTWSRSCWIGLFSGLLIYFLFHSAGALLLLPFSALSAFFASVIFPDTFGMRIKNFISMNDSANRYRIKVWHGSFRAFLDNFLTGAGAGNQAFRSVYLNFTLPGAETAPHSHSIYLQYGISYGIIPLFLLLALFFVLLKKVSGLRSDGNPCVSTEIAFTAFSAAAALMICGIFDNVFYNYRVLFLFFTICGMCSSAASCQVINIEEENKNNPCEADILLGLK